MTIPFFEFFERLRSATDITTQMDLARALGLNRSAITQAKLRNAVPPKWILALARRYALSPDWIEFGVENMHAGPTAGKLAVRNAPGKRNGQARSDVKRPARQPRIVEAARTPYPEGGEDIVYVPKAAARLCAGGGSFEIEAQPVAAYPFPRWWLAKMGSPSSMVFMDVVGDSMEPGICNGDTVLVDQSHTRVDLRNVLAVSVADAIYLKRVEPCGDGVILHSDNDMYADMELYGDELEHFRIIGKVVWLCRDCRY